MAQNPDAERAAMARPVRTVLADAVYEALKAMLMDSRIAPGAPLRTDALAAELGVSRTPVRESLARLVADGLVVKQPLVGYRVTAPLDRAGLEELFAVRLLLEPAAAALAASLADEAQRTSLTSPADPRLAAPPAAGGPYPTYRAFVTEDARFHGLIADASANALLAESIRRLNSHVHTYRIWTRGDTPIAALQEHGLIMEAIRERDPGAAEQAMRRHLEGALERLSATY